MEAGLAKEPHATAVYTVVQFTIHTITTRTIRKLLSSKKLTKPCNYLGKFLIWLDNPRNVASSCLLAAGGRVLLLDDCSKCCF